MGRASTNELTQGQKDSLHQLYSAIADMAQNGHRVPCTGEHWKAWTSDEDEAQTYAAAHCQACPLLSMCRAHIDQYPEPVSVWAGLLPKERN